MAAHDYEIHFRGEADVTVRAAFPEFAVTVAQGTTVLRAWLPDQAALHGALNRIADLGVELVEVHALDQMPD